MKKQIENKILNNVHINNQSINRKKTSNNGISNEDQENKKLNHQRTNRGEISDRASGREVLGELKTFTILWLGQLLSGLGSNMTSFALVIWAFSQRNSVMLTSILAMSSQLPRILLSFLAGYLVDRWNKKSVMLVADTVAALGSASVLVLFCLGKLTLVNLCLINVVIGITQAFQTPAASVAVSLLISKKYYTKVSGMQSFSGAMMSILTPIIATAVYAFGGLEIVLAIDLITFAFAFISLAVFIKIPQVIQRSSKRVNPFKTCLEGISYIKEQKGILKFILFMGFVNLIVAIYSSNLSTMILARTNYNNVQLGLVTSTIGVAGIIGSIAVSIRKPTKNHISMIFNTITFSFLVCNTLLGIGRNYYIWMAAVFMGNLFIPFFTASVEYVMRTKVPVELQGRVFSARDTLQYVSIPIGYFLGGALADQVFEPLMLSDSKLAGYLSYLVGRGQGSGMAVILVLLGIIGFVGCLLFRRSKDIRSLNE